MCSSIIIYSLELNPLASSIQNFLSRSVNTERFEYQCLQIHKCVTNFLLINYTVEVWQLQYVNMYSYNYSYNFKL